MATNRICLWNEGGSILRRAPFSGARQRYGFLACVRISLLLLSGAGVLNFACLGTTLSIPIDTSISAADESGACILRVQVDGSSDLMVKGDSLTLRAVHGANPVDQGSVCSEILPEAPLGSFRMELLQGRGRALLVENPSGRNGYQAWIRVDDNSSGADLYELRLSWQQEEDRSGMPDAEKNELILRPRGSPAVWTAESGAGGSANLPGDRLNSFDNDSLRYDSSRAGQLEFRGRVDDAVDFYIRGDQLNALVKSGQLVKVERFRFTQPLPAVTLSSINVERKDGRGTVELLQRPDSTNDFTAIVRVIDPQSGSDRYHWILSWVR